jgi:hypothetical protein
MLYHILLLFSLILVTYNCKPEVPETSTNGIFSELLRVRNRSQTSSSQSISQVADPVFSLPSGNYLMNRLVTITSTTSDVKIYYTINGENPTTSSTEYTSAINIWSNAGVIKAIAMKTGMNNSNIISVTYSLQPLKTGQTTIYTANDDGTTQNGLNRSYTDNANGTITDSITGLVWEKCIRGRSGTNCATGSSITDTYTNQNTYCSTNTLAGLKWRLPNIRELETIPSYNTFNPAINVTIFPQTGTNNFWTETTYSLSTANAHMVSFFDGYSNNLSKTFTHSVRCVSGETKKITMSLIDNQDSTVTDTATGLIWQKCPQGLSSNLCDSGSATPTQFNAAITYCNTLTLVGKSWRVPNINELKTIVDYTVTNAPTIQSSFFPNTSQSPNYYWSSSSYANGGTDGWYINFNTGSFNYNAKNGNYYVRCVSGP